MIGCIKMSRKPDMFRKRLSLPCFLTFCLILFGGKSEAKNCATDSPCKCTFDDGSGTVDISSIGKNDGTALIQDQFATDNYAYSFNPCYPFTEGTCSNAAACQYDSNNNIYYNIGDSSKVAFSYDGTNVIGTYTADDDARTSTVSFICDESVDPPTYTTDGETSTAVYGFSVTSKYACPTGGSSPSDSSSSGSLGVGSILVIAFFSIIVIYVIVGMVFNKFVRHNSGKELVPQVNLWLSIPGLVKDGGKFVIGKITRRGGYGSV